MKPEFIYIFLIFALLVLLAFGLGLRYWLRLPPKVLATGELPVRTVQVGDWVIRYHISGRGPHLVLLHGIGANLFCWRWLVPLLNTRFTVIAPDLPGFGQSSKPMNVHYGLDDQVERIQDFLYKIGVKKTYLVGNSMGGNIALWYALRFPDEVLGTAVIAPATSPTLIPVTAAKLAWLAKPLSLVVTKRAMNWAHRRTVSKKHLVSRDRIEETFKTYGGKAEAVRSFLLSTESIRDRRLSQRLVEIKTPVLILWGSRDQLVSRKVIDDLERALALKESHVHLGGGHHLQEDEPEWVHGKIDAFFRATLD